MVKTMNVLWVSFAALGRAGEIIENRANESGNWIDALRSLLANYDVKIALACISNKNGKFKDTDNSIYYGLNNIKKTYGISEDRQEVSKWKSVIHDFKPDIIMIWGTEWGNSARIIEAADGIPVLFFIQGVLGRIVMFPFGNISKAELRKNLDIVTRIKWNHYKRINHKQNIQARTEEKIVTLSDGVITDNEWSTSYYNQYIDQNHIFQVSLPVNSIFLKDKYNLDSIEKHSIFSVTCNNPSKGVHNLIKALSIVKKSFPDVKVFLPGNIKHRKPSIIYKSPYLEYLESLIKKLGLQENVFFCGSLTQENIKKRLLLCNAFVMPSCVENHSSSLREALYLGVPSISSSVGSVPEYLFHNKNGLLYRYEEYEVLAYEIMKIFSNDDLAQKLGNNAYNDIRIKYPQNTIASQMLNIYKNLIKNN